MASARTDAWTVRKGECRYTTIMQKDLHADQNIIIKGLVCWIVLVKLHRRDQAESCCSNRAFRFRNCFRGLRRLHHGATIQEPVLLCVRVSQTISSESRRMIHLSLLEAAAATLGFPPRDLHPATGHPRL
jgi:hypothetical protein